MAANSRMTLDMGGVSRRGRGLQIVMEVSSPIPRAMAGAKEAIPGSAIATRAGVQTRLVTGEGEHDPAVRTMDHRKRKNWGVIVGAKGRKMRTIINKRMFFDRLTQDGYINMQGARNIIPGRDS